MYTCSHIKLNDACGQDASDPALHGRFRTGTTGTCAILEFLAYRFRSTRLVPGSVLSRLPVSQIPKRRARAGLSELSMQKEFVHCLDLVEALTKFVHFVCHTSIHTHMERWRAPIGLYLHRL